MNFADDCVRSCYGRKGAIFENWPDTSVSTSAKGKANFLMAYMIFSVPGSFHGSWPLLIQDSSGRAETDDPTSLAKLNEVGKKTTGSEKKDKNSYNETAILYINEYLIKMCVWDRLFSSRATREVSFFTGRGAPENWGIRYFFLDQKGDEKIFQIKQGDHLYFFKRNKIFC